MSKLRISISPLLIAVLFSACSNSGLPNEDISAIKNTLDTSVRLELEGDLDNYYKLFTEDVVLMPRIIPAVEGLESFKKIPLISLREKEMTINSIEGAGDIAYVRFDLTILRSVESALLRRHKGIQILRKQDNGTWLISLIIVNSAE